MRPSRRRGCAQRVPRVEAMEPRLLMSAEPAGDFALDYFVENQLYEEVQLTLADAHALTGLDQARSEYGLTGIGQTVAVIDTGIAYGHTAFATGSGSRVVGGFDFTDERDDDPYDDGPYGSHGTHVAGIIGGSDEASLGVAPGVDLVALRVFDDDGSGYFHWVEEALQWIHTNYNNYDVLNSPITAVNLSLGCDWNSDRPPAWAMLEDELAQLRADGIFISVAAGNGFTAYQEPGLSYPAVSPHVVPVASVDDGGGLSYFSQRDVRVIAAPGRSVLSSVPDYAGNHNGVDDDFARYSGTSMATPYVAGASVLLRQAYEFVGVADVTQDTIYGLMASTADTIRDSETGLDFYRLNVARALDAVMPEDDYGSSQETAHQLGTLADSHQVVGTIGRLGDHDWFSFTAAFSGSVTVEVDADGELLPQWELVGAARDTDGLSAEALSFDVIAGHQYQIGLATDAGLGHYTLDLDLEPAFSYTDWGTVGQNRFEGHRIDAAGQWFAVTAAADGILTTEALFAHADGDVDLELRDADGQVLGVSQGMGDSERIDVTVSAGQTLYLHAYVYGNAANDDVDFRITNLVSQSGGAVDVLGTAGDDRFTFAAGATHQVTINGVQYSFDAAEVSSVRFDGLAGNDSAVLTGAAGNDSAVLRPGSAELTGVGYQVVAAGVERVTVQGGGGSGTAVFYDSPGNDVFVADPLNARLYAQGLYCSAVGFETVEAIANAGGFDIAKLLDSAGNDLFITRPTEARMFGNGFSNRARLFEQTHGYALFGGFDMAKLIDSAGDDTFVADPIQGALYGSGFYSRAKHFEQVHAYALHGGTDVARLYDSAGDDRFEFNSIQGALYGQGFYNRAKHFAQVHADGHAGGHDRAYLDDSFGDDHLAAADAWARLVGEGYDGRVDGFDFVRASASGGTDDAEVSAVDFILELAGGWA